MSDLEQSFYRSRTAQRLRAEGLAEGLLDVLAHREVFVPDDVRERIASCEDHKMLRAWLLRACQVDEADQIFADHVDG
jgi:hypothetical protein